MPSYLLLVVQGAAEERHLCPLLQQLFIQAVDLLLLLIHLMERGTACQCQDSPAQGFVSAVLQAEVKGQRS